MINYDKVSLTKMLNVVFIVMLIPFITLSLWLYNNNRNEIKNTINETMTQFVSNVSFMYIKPHVERINNEFMLLRNDKSTSVNLMDLNDDNNEFIKAAISSFNRTPHLSGVIISNNKKEFIILPEINISEYDVEERPWFPHYGKDGEVVYSNAYTSSYSEYRGDNRMIITAAMNVFNSNKRKIGTVAYDLDMNYLSEKLKYITLPFNSHLKVTDKKGMYIINDSINKNMTARVPVEWVEAADNKQGSFYDKKSRNHIFYYTYPNPEWVIFAVISEKDYNKEVGKMDAGFLVALLSSSLYYLFLQYYVILFVITF
ncbi:cache domain-containing protein [Kluyvera genomosp. 2]|uniref:cache domain-containing protein n=1 Tax=Kluyvera genomosp. 2 TaxID=2774054 RepID=UPI002FD81AF9